MCHWPLSQIQKIRKIAKYIKLGLKIMEGSRLHVLYKDVTYSNNGS